jgi:hypothetical protein
MNSSIVDQVAQAVLYEGYLLYPYRPSVKNRQRWTFGGLYPPAYSEAQGGTDASRAEMQCLVASHDYTLGTVSVRVRFLHLLLRRHEPALGDAETAGPVEPPADWQEAMEREVAMNEIDLADLIVQPREELFAFPASRWAESWREANGRQLGTVVRRQHAVRGKVVLAAQDVADGLVRLTARVENETPLETGAAIDRDEAILASLVSTHAILGVRGAEFVSLLEPPDAWREAAEACRQVGLWPVLAGEPGQRDTMLAAPIILYDYPQVAPESPGDLFDATEIDEILTLRILTLTDEEKRAMSALDTRAHALLARTEALAREQLMGLHGTFRGLQPWSTASGDESRSQGRGPENQAGPLDAIRVAGVEYRRGARVRLQPGGDADIFDLALKGRTATIAAIEQDYEDHIHLAVTVDDDPGRDLGVSGQPGHRFYFRPDEVVPLDDEPRRDAP